MCVCVREWGGGGVCGWLLVVSAGAGGQERDFGLKELKISLVGFERLTFMFSVKTSIPLSIA